LCRVWDVSVCSEQPRHNPAAKYPKPPNRFTKQGDDYPCVERTAIVVLWVLKFVMSTRKPRLHINVMLRKMVYLNR